MAAVIRRAGVEDLERLFGEEVRKPRIKEFVGLRDVSRAR
jgi:hypothetical protein